MVILNLDVAVESNAQLLRCADPADLKRFFGENVFSWWNVSIQRCFRFIVLFVEHSGVAALGQRYVR